MKKKIKASLDRKKSILLLGPRQTGKTTVLSQFSFDMSINLMRPKLRQRYERDPSVLEAEIKALGVTECPPLIFIDEIQKVPELLDEIQVLVDEKLAVFVLTGSSARKIRKQSSQVNLLPGRLVSLRLDPLSLSESQPKDIEFALMYGALPGIIQVKIDSEREEDLRSYVETYLEEEIRAEAEVRDLGKFGRFLELASVESGNIINF